MTSLRPLALPTVALTLLAGCAAAAAPASSATSSPASERDRDCSFRSATTCWTLAPRVPERRAEASPTAPDSITVQPAPVLASRADSAVSQ